MSNSLNLDQDQHSVSPDPGLNCFYNKRVVASKES